MAQSRQAPAHLEPSQLGTREYWDEYYQNDLDQNDDNDEPVEPSELESWFDDVDAPAKVLDYLTSPDFPLSPDLTGDRPCSVLDLGTGNGSTLFSLRIEGNFQGPMVGVDYSEQSVNLARRLSRQYAAQFSEGQIQDHQRSGTNSIRFEKIDLLRDDPSSAEWWPTGGFDLVLDKGTFDAISLSSETIEDGSNGQVRICELYPRKTVEMIALGGYMLVTSCNWTEQEVTRWFLQGTSTEGQLEVFGNIQYPSYEFGGQKGQGVASVCFRRIK